TNTASYFLTLDPWDQREPAGRTADVVIAELNQRLNELTGARAFAVPPPAIPGVGTSGGITFMLEDRAGKDIDFPPDTGRTFIDAARRRPELATVNTSFTPSVPQLFADVDQDKVLRQGVNLSAVYQTLQVFFGGYFVNDFNLYGRVWQVYVQAEGELRTRADYIDQFYVRNRQGTPVPLASMVTMKPSYGPDMSIRFNEYRAAEINSTLAPRYSTQPGMRAL